MLLQLILLKHIFFESKIKIKKGKAEKKKKYIIIFND